MDEIIELLLSNFSLTLLVIWLIVSILLLSISRKNKAYKTEKILAYFFLFNLGFSGIYGGVMHICFGDYIANFIGWPQSPFQVEVGIANLAFGITGLLSFCAHYSFRLATLVNFSVFLWGAAIGHIYQMIEYGNFAPGNAGVIFWTDIFLPIIGFILLYLNKRNSNRQINFK